MTEQGSRFKIAFAVKKAEADEFLDNKYYVQWKAMIIEGSYSQEKKEIRRTVGVHKCLPSDYAQFYPLSNQNEEHLAELEHLKPHLWCLNDSDDQGNVLTQQSFYGPIDGTSHRRLDIIYQPCIPRQLDENNKHMEGEKCLADYHDLDNLEDRLTKSIEYLGTPVVKIYHNWERVSTSQSVYGAESIISESKIISKQFSTKMPTWFHF